MATFVAVVALIILGNALLLVILSHVLGSPASGPSEGLEEIGIENYRPMLRLLSERDLIFLRSQPGYKPPMERRLRAQRCRIFRGYLRSLERDFKRTCTALKMVVVQAEVDRADLASLVLRSQLAFAYHVVILQVNVELYRWGIGTADCAALLCPYVQLRNALNLLAPIPEPNAA